MPYFNRLSFILTLLLIFFVLTDTSFEKVHLIDANLDETDFSHFHASRDISSNEFELCRFAFLLLVRK